MNLRGSNKHIITIIIIFINNSLKHMPLVTCVRSTEGIQVKLDQAHVKSTKKNFSS